MDVNLLCERLYKISCGCTIASLDCIMQQNCSAPGAYGSVCVCDAVFQGVEWSEQVWLCLTIYKTCEDVKGSVQMCRPTDSLCVCTSLKTHRTGSCNPPTETESEACWESEATLVWSAHRKWVSGEDDFSVFLTNWGWEASDFHLHIILQAGSFMML